METIGFKKFINEGPLEDGNSFDVIFSRILESFYSLSKENNEKTTNRSELTIFDLTPNGKITKDVILDIIYYTLIKQSIFGFEKEKKIFDSKMVVVKKGTLQEKLDIIRSRQQLFFRNSTHKNLAYAHIAKIWDIAPSIATLTTVHSPSEKRIGEKPRNFDEFVDRITDASQNKKLKGTARLSRCHFAKTILAIAMALDSKTMDKADTDILKGIIQIRKVLGLQITAEKYGSLEFTFQGKGLDGRSISYSGVFQYRLKAIEKIVLKELYNREYGDINQMGDLGGARCIIATNPNEDLNQQIRLHAAKIFPECMFGRGKPNKKELRTKGEFLAKETLEKIFSIGGFSPRKGDNKSGVGDIHNISVISPNPNNNIELQIESPGNMEAFYESPEWNDIKKILSASSRDLLALSISNVLLLLELYLPEGFDAKVAFLDLIHKKQLLVGKVDTDTIGFIMVDIYTQEYERYYKNYPLKLEDISKNPQDDAITRNIDIIRNNKVYKKALLHAREKREQAYKALENFKFK